MNIDLASDCQLLVLNTVVNLHKRDRLPGFDYDQIERAVIDQGYGKDTVAVKTLMLALQMLAMPPSQLLEQYRDVITNKMLYRPTPQGLMLDGTLNS